MSTLRNQIVTFSLAGTQSYQEVAEMCKHQSNLGTVYVYHQGAGLKDGEEYTPNLFLVPEPSNQYDENAVRVDVDTKDVYTIGYIPRSICMSCGKNNTGKEAETPTCKHCGAVDSKMEMNKYIKDKIQKDRVLRYKIVAITSAGANSTMGVKIRIEFKTEDLVDDPLHRLAS